MTNFDGHVRTMEEEKLIEPAANAVECAGWLDSFLL
jgi:hypothetical protein